VKKLLFDTHAHIDAAEFGKDLVEVWQRAQQAGVTRVINVAIDLPSARRAVDLANAHEGIYATVGVHPHFAKDFGPSQMQAMVELARQPRVVAIGETGLDFYRDRSPRDAQRQAFREQIRLARRLRLPVVIHDRNAHAETMAILKEEEAADVGGVWHCFSGDVRLAREVLAMGFFISFAGPLTYPKADSLREVARQVNLSRVLIETDCPYLTPQAHRGKRNEPAFVYYVAEALANIRGMTVERVAELTTANARRLFRIYD
jgi:TatD DNase family protein